MHHCSPRCCHRAACTVQVVRLHDRNSSLLAELEEIKTARSNRSLAGKGVDKGQAALDAAAKAAAAYSVADKELLLKQIDSLKEVRIGSRVQ